MLLDLVEELQKCGVDITRRDLIEAFKAVTRKEKEKEKEKCIAYHLYPLPGFNYCPYCGINFHQGESK